MSEKPSEGGASSMEALSDEARAMLDAERRRPTLPSDVSERVFAHLATSIAVMGGGGSPGGDGSASPPAAPVVHGASHAISAISTRTLPYLLGAALVGGGVGAGIHAQLTKPAPPVIVTARAIEASPPPPPSSAPSQEPEAPAITPSASALPSPPPRTASAEKSDKPGKDVDLGGERALIERARMAIARGQGDSALEALGQHAKEFPRGRLIEEREALTVQALVRAGRMDEAQARAAQFRARFPASVFLAVVNAAVGAAP